MAEKVNLDALIPREDLEATTYVQRGRKKDTVSISDLLSDSFFLLTQTSHIKNAFCALINQYFNS